MLTSLVIAVSGVEDATAAIRDTRDNLMSREPLGLAPCLCHRLVKSSQVTFIYIALLTIQIVTKQLHNIKMGK